MHADSHADPKGGGASELDLPRHRGRFFLLLILIPILMHADSDADRKGGGASELDLPGHRGRSGDGWSGGSHQCCYDCCCCA